MKIKPIHDQEGLAEAQLYLAELLAGNQSGQYDDEVEMLSILIEHFEAANFPLAAPSPIAAIRFRMNEIGMAPRELEPYIGSRARVWEVLSGKRSLSIDMIRSLHFGLGIPLESLISSHTDRRATEASPHVAPHKHGFDEFAMPSPLRPTAEAFSPALLRKSHSRRAASKTNQAALISWQTKVLTMAREFAVADFDGRALNEKYLRDLAKISAQNNGPGLAIQNLNSFGIKVVVLPAFPGTFLDGAAMISSGGCPIVALTLRYDRIDNFWFTLLHELAHLVLHFDKLSNVDFAFFDDLDINSDDQLERDADELAKRSLVPKSIINTVHWGVESSDADIRAVAIRARVHPSIVAGRWQREHKNYRKFARLIERNTLKSKLNLESDGATETPQSGRRK